MLWPIDSGSGWRNVEDVGLFTDDDDEKDMAMNERTVLTRIIRNPLAGREWRTTRFKLNNLMTWKFRSGRYRTLNNELVKIG